MSFQKAVWEVSQTHSGRVSGSLRKGGLIDAIVDDTTSLDLSRVFRRRIKFQQVMLGLSALIVT